MKQRTDAEFIEAIDACFPVDDRAQALMLIRESQQLSENSALMIAYELACADDRPSDLRMSLLDELIRTDRAAVHVAAPIVRAIIAGANASRIDLEQLLQHCRHYPGLHNGLCLLLLATPERHAEAEALRQSWRDASVDEHENGDE